MAKITHGEETGPIGTAAEEIIENEVVVFREDMRRLAALRERLESLGASARKEEEMVRRKADRLAAPLLSEARRLERRVICFAEQQLGKGREGAFRCAEGCVRASWRSELLPLDEGTWAEVVRRLKKAQKNDALAVMERVDANVVAYWEDAQLQKYGIKRSHRLEWSVVPERAHHAQRGATPFGEPVEGRFVADAD